MEDKVRKAIAAYIKLRDNRDEIKKRQAEEISPLLEQMKTLEGWLHAKLQKDGLDSFKKKGTGTAYLSTTTRAKVVDWEALIEFIKEQDNYSFLEQRVSKSVVEDYIENSGGELPPGVTITSEENVRIRRG